MRIDDLPMVERSADQWNRSFSRGRNGIFAEMLAPARASGSVSAAPPPEGRLASTPSVQSALADETSVRSADRRMSDVRAGRAGPATTAPYAVSAAHDFGRGPLPSLGVGAATGLSARAAGGTSSPGPLAGVASRVPAQCMRQPAGAIMLVLGDADRPWLSVRVPGTDRREEELLRGRIESLARAAGFSLSQLLLNGIGTARQAEEKGD